MSDIFTFVSPETLAAGGGGTISRVQNDKIMRNFCLSTDCHWRWGRNLTTHLHLAPQLKCMVLLPSLHPHAFMAHTGTLYFRLGTVILVGQGYPLREHVLLPIGFRRQRLSNMGQGYTKNKEVKWYA
jgi:hypothetical protein